MPSAVSCRRRGWSDVLMICRRYTFSTNPPATSRPSAPRSRITFTRKGLRMPSDTAKAIASARINPP
ncbi:Uncharacterised protein [Bordetella pertussis]|nr:Uncharacterised protein [Bordetella pertussis]